MNQKKGALTLLELISRLPGIVCGVFQFKLYICIFMASSMQLYKSYDPDSSEIASEMLSCGTPSVRNCANF